MTDRSTPEDRPGTPKAGSRNYWHYASGYTTPETPEEPDLALRKR